jgi:hypothetical protein
MKLNTTLVAIALALAGGAASAATVGTLYDTNGIALPNNPEIGPLAYTAFESDGPGDTYTPTFDYVYNFVLDADSDLTFTGNAYYGPTVAAATANFSLYSGTSAGESGNAGNFVNGNFSFAGATVATTTFANLTAGSYFFEITGSPATPIGTSFNVTIQAPNAVGPLPAVPEPANMALMLGGLGLMGFMMKRRSRN